MLIYNFLFYNGYLLGKKSGNFKDIPVLAGVICVVPFFIYNFFSVLFVIAGLKIKVFEYDRSDSFYIAFLLLILFLLYYSLNKRYIKIVDSFDKKNIPNSTKFQLLVFFSYHLIGFVILLISGLFKNKDWIFK
jgi:uncharacterized membrane protein YfcA